jgi:hypothetical protein
MRGLDVMVYVSSGIQYNLHIGACRGSPVAKDEHIHGMDGVSSECKTVVSS